MPFLYCFLALALAGWLVQFDYFIGHDGVWYARIAENLMAGKGLAVNAGELYLDHPPFYPFLIGVANFFFKNTELSGHIVSIVAFSLTLIPLFFLTRKVYGALAAHWAALLFATNGFLLVHSHVVLAEPLFILLAMLLTYLVHRIMQGQSQPLPLAVLVGTAAGLAYLTRPEGLLFYLAAISAWFLSTLKTARSHAKAILLSLCCFLLFFLPHFLFVYQHTGKIELSGAVTEIFVKRQMSVAHPDQYLEAKKIFEGLTEDKTKMKLDELKEGFDLLHYLQKDDYALLRSGFSSLVPRLLSFSNYFFGGLGFFFVGASFLSVPWDTRRKKSEGLFLILLMTIIPQFFGIFHPKRYLLYYPFFLMWMGNGLEVGRRWAAESFNLSLRRSFLAVFGVLLFFALASASYLKRVVGDNAPYEYKELGLWMKRSIPHIKEERVAARHPSVIFYSGAKILNPPYLPYVEKFEDLLIYLRHQRAKYFVIGEDLERPTLDSYRFLLNEGETLRREISRVHTIQGRKKVILFEVTG